MNDKTFDILGNTPADLGHPGLALATARAGGIGLLDLQFSRDQDKVRDNFVRLCEATDARIGLRITPDHAELAKSLIQQAGARALTLVLSAPVATLPELRASVGLRPQDRCLAEITSPEDAAAATGQCDGLMLRGHEAGGWVGENTSYIMLQKLRGQTRLPIYLQGGVGVHGAAACRIAGAAGIVLDDALLLLAESPLPESQKDELARLNGAETRLLGELIGRPCRVYVRPGSAALKAIEAKTRTAEGGGQSADEWVRDLSTSIGWSADGTLALPLGQAIGLAGTYRQRYRTVARLMQAVRRASSQQAEQAAKLHFIDEGGPLAASHGTRFPLCQGPMTRVSDSPDFAVAVAEGGALPFLALALMRGPQVAQMLEQTKARIGDKPWGVGLLGFIPHALREEQCAEIWKCKPDYALIAGGRPDQAAEFESRGIPAYIHAPAPALLKMYLEQGARRFVFEGRECGGHIGPLASFPMWEQMIEVLLANVPAGEEAKTHVLFAGGIHDATSAAMVAAMAAPLAARGMKVGALMGTAYLFTHEIVATGAVVQGFQDEALRCRHTMNLETGPGHATRCVDTKFAHDFYDTRKRLIGEGKSAEEIRDILEDLNLGRLRVASKGVDRDADGKIVTIAPEQQLTEGMYMIGQVATLRDQALSIEALHRNVCHDGQALLDALAEARAGRSQAAKPADVAIVGIGTLLPKADNADDYWSHIVHKITAFGEVPATRWDWQQYFDGDRKTRDKVYSRWGGFLDEIAFDPMRFGIPPRSMKSIDPMQLLTLEVASRAIDDAGYAEGGFDRETTSIILGAGGGLGDLGLQYGVRAELPRFVENISDEVWDRLPEWTEESFAGTLLNVAAGRVANRLDFGGVNFTVDAACASSLAAISLAVGELESGRSSMVLAGGIDTVQSPFGFLCFSKTQALSPTGSPKTFDQSADGIAISEGLAVVALKRLADAERDGDRIYAVIKAVAGSSDGKALGLTAPRPEGQVRALQRAYRKAGFSPVTLGLAEAHGTGTAVGDRAEAQTITRALSAENAAPKSVALGSVKTLIGHTKASAGVAGLIKVTLSLYHRVLPAHHGVSNPIDTIADAQSPVYLLKEARPWLAHPDHPRRAGVSAFGFGGTNFHAVLEEYRDGVASDLGERQWPTELYLFRAADAAALTKDVERARGWIAEGSRIVPGELALMLARGAQSKAGGAASLAIAADNLDQLRRDLDTVLARLRDNGEKPLPPHIKLNLQTPTAAPQTAFVFPGQGAQYVNMARESGLYLEELRSALELADATLRDDIPELLSNYILPPAVFDDAGEQAQQRALTDTRIAQPAIGSVALGYLRFVQRLGVQAVATAGHSYGEYAALHAAGVIGAEDFLRLSAVRGRAMADAAKAAAPGTMAAVQAARDQVDALIAPFDGVRIANHNAPEQSVISGPKAAVEQAVKAIGEAGLRAVLLPVSGAFHTELVAAAQAPLSAAIHAAAFHSPNCAVYANTNGAPYPAEPVAIQQQLDGHLLHSVEFVSEIEAMYAAGCRVFLELGPKSICSNMVRQILAGKDAVAVSLDSGGSLKGTLLGLAELFASGVAFDALRLFDNRNLALLDAQQLAEQSKPRPLAKHTWMISGGCARPIDDPQFRTGKLPALTKATAEQARARIEAARAPAQPASAPTPMAAGMPPAAAPAALSSDAILAYQQTMRQFLQLQERVIQQYLGGGSADAGALPAMPTPFPTAAPATAALPPPQLPAAAVMPMPPTVAEPAPAVPAPAPVAVTPPAIPTAATPAVDFRTLLLGIVAERTGYPEDMLGLDADLEADLGIDSIKRVEILGAFQKAMPGDLGNTVQGAMERFTRAKSLNAILAEMGKLESGSDIAAAAMPAAVSPATPVAAPAAAESIPRYALIPTPAPLSGERVTLSGLTLLLGGPDPITAALTERLRGDGAVVVSITADEPDAIRQQIAAAREAHGPVRTVAHLHGLSEATAESLDEWREKYRRNLLSLFHTAQALGDDIRTVRLIAATRLGGTFGRDTMGTGSITAGGVVGITNCLRHEFPDSVMRSVDFDGQDDATIAELLHTELCAQANEPEVGYADTDRLGSTTVERPLTDSPFSPHLTPEADWVVLATGGARGITAEIIEELIKPGMRLVLLGRSAEPAPEGAETSGIDDTNALRKALIATELSAGRKPKPADIDRDIARLRANREIRANLQRMRSAGALVDYVACDVRDEAVFGQLIDDLYDRLGRIDLAIHGAGVIEDKLLADKTAESFERVLSTKLDAAFVLSRKLRPESLKCLALFTSVAGRYGNRGQSDYAAANETLNRMAWDLQHRWSDTRVISINWGPWDAGMASEAVKQAFRERGIDPIPVAAGRRMFREELELGPRHEVELVAGRGTWGLEQAPPLVSGGGDEATELPLIRMAPRIGPGGSMTLDHRLTVDSDPYLMDHRLDDKPVLPAAGAAEWMAEFASAAWPGWIVSEVKDMRMFNGIVLDSDQGRGIQLRARASSHSDAGSQAVTVEIIDAARKLPAYRATVVLVQQLPEAPLAPTIAALQDAKTVSAEQAYADYLFHGERFQLVTAIDGVSESGIDATVQPSSVNAWLGRDGEWLFDPGLMDVPPQLAIVWSRVNHEMTALPAAFGSVRRYAGNAEGPLRLALRMRSAPHDNAVVYDAWFIDRNGRVRLEMLQLEGTMSAALNRLAGHR